MTSTPKPEDRGLDPDTERLVVVTGIDLVRRIGNLRREFEAVEDAVGRRSDVDTWYHVETFLGYAAAISVVFWPVPEKQPETDQARTLRRLFEVNDDSPLKSGAVRCLLVHHDGDAASDDHSPLGASVGARIARTLDRGTMTVSYHDEVIGLGDLKDAADQLLASLRGVSRQLDDLLSSTADYCAAWATPPTAD